MPKSKWSALVSLLLVFCSGALVGAVANRLYMVNTVRTAPPRLSPEEARKRQVTEMHDRVKLDDHQVELLNQIYDRTRQRFDDLHKQGSQQSRAIWDEQKDEIRAMLRPDQVPLYDQYQKERDEQHRRERERRQQEGKGTK